MMIKGKERKFFIVGQYSKDDINRAEDPAFSSRLLADKACVMKMFLGDIHVCDRIEKLIEDLNFMLGLGTLIQLNYYRACLLPTMFFVTRYLSLKRSLVT